MWEILKKTWNDVKARLHGVIAWGNEMLDSGDFSKANKKFEHTYNKKSTEYKVGGMFEKAGGAVAQGFNQVKSLAQNIADGLIEKADSAPTPKQTAEPKKTPHQESAQTSHIREKYGIESKQPTSGKPFWFGSSKKKSQSAPSTSTPSNGMNR